MINSFLFYTRQILREVLHRKKFSAFFIFNLSIGLLGLTLISSFDGSLRRFLDDNLRYQLNADLVARSRQPFSEAALKILENASKPQNEFGVLQTSKTVELNSMASTNFEGNVRSKIVSLNVVDENFPLLSRIILQQKGIITPKNGQVLLEKASEALVDDDLASFLGLEIGQSFKLGDINLTVADILQKNDLDVGSSFFPRVYINFEAALASGLLGKTSRTRHIYSFELSEPTKVQDLKQHLESAFNKLKIQSEPETLIRVRSYEESSNNILNISNIVLSYLTLVGIMVFVLSALGSMYLYRHYVQKKYPEIAIFKILGMSKKQLSIIFAGQMLTISSLGLLVNFVLSYIVISIASIFLKGAFYPEFVLALDFLTFIKIGLIAFLGFPVFCLPSLLSLKRLKLSGLFSEFGSFAPSLSKAGLFRSFAFKVLSYLPLMLFFLLCTLLISYSKNGLYFYGALVLMFLIFALLGYLFLRLLEFLFKTFNQRLTNNKMLVFKHFLLLVLRYKSSFLQCFVALATASFLIFLIPQIYRGVSSELAPVEGKTPEFFLFDIQPEQLDSLTDLAKAQGAILDNASPMLRVRLSKVNDTPLAKWQESRGEIQFGDVDEDLEDDENEAASGRVNFNVSYKDSWNLSEKIVKGDSDFSKFVPQGKNLPKISLESGFAVQNGFSMGDKLTFEIYGDEITGYVANLREVKWNYFFPNFFIVFQTGVLEEYPHIRLANLTGLNEQNQNSFKNKLFDEFSNITMFDIRQTVTTILNLAKNIVTIALIICVLSLVAGMISIYGIMLAESERQKVSYNLFKVLGLESLSIGKMALLQYGLLSMFGAFFSLILALIGYFAVSRFVFNSFWQANYSMLGLIWLLISFFATSWMFLAALRVILGSPLKIFSQH